MLAHWPQHSVARRRVGMGGGLADFQALIQDPTNGGSPEFSAAWSGVEGQLVAEGESDLTGAKIAMADAFSQISSSSFGVTVQQAAQAAQQYVLMGQTVLGAVNMIVGMAELPSAARDKAVLAFTGTMIGTLTTVAIGAGAVTAGLGAAIVLGVGAILSVMQSEGLIGGKPPAAGTICGVGYTSQPDFVVGCLGGWGPKVAPGSPNWRPFPEPGNATDKVWFQPGSFGPGNWRGAFFGVGSSGADQRWGKSGNPNPPSNTWRPIDEAFDAYNAVVEGLVPGPQGFPESYRTAWKANGEYAFNGLAVQPDWAVLVHTLRMWNRGHNGPAVQMPASWYLIQQAINNTPKSDPLVSGNTLLVNIGALKKPVAPVVHLTLADLAPGGQTSGRAAAAALPWSPQNPFGYKAPAPMSTGAKVAVGGAAVGGTALLATAVYSAVVGETVGAVLKHAWRKVF
jgi:hypothetical protein